LLTLSTNSLRKLAILVIVGHLNMLESVRVVESSGWSERQSQTTNGLIKLETLQFQALYYRKIILDKLYPPLVHSARTTFHEVTHAPALFESPRDNTPFLSHVSALGLKPLGGYSRQKGVCALGAFKTGQVHLVMCHIGIALEYTA
jgi:hypothetical protein